MQALKSGRKLLTWSQLSRKQHTLLPRNISMKMDEQKTYQSKRIADRNKHFCGYLYLPQLPLNYAQFFDGFWNTSSKEIDINCDLWGKEHTNSSKEKKTISSLNFLSAGCHSWGALWVAKSLRGFRPSQTLQGLCLLWARSLSSSSTCHVRTFANPGRLGPHLTDHIMTQPTQMYSRGRETVEKKLLHLMDMWKVEDAVVLLRKSVEEGIVPHPNVVLDLQQQLANLGEVECLMELHEFLKSHNLASDDKFFRCLQEAYYNSGRISEGVDVLRILYHNSRKFPDVEIYFTLLTIMVLRHFPDRMSLILSFVRDLKDAEEPVLEPEASLWKCYMMMEKWSEADKLLLNNKELQPLLPQQVARVCQNVDKADFARAEVLSHMLDLPFIRQKLRVLVAETLVAELCSQKQWTKVLKVLKRIKSSGLPMHADKLSQALDNLQQKLTPQFDQQIEDLRLWCDSLQEEAKE